MTYIKSIWEHIFHFFKWVWRIATQLKRTVVGTPISDDLEEPTTDIGDRPPKSYLKTETDNDKDRASDGRKPWIKGTLNLHSHPPLTEWEHLSKQLLREFFAELGVEYVPEIVIYAIEVQDPVSAFADFCSRFDFLSGRRASRRYLQDVVLFLFDMDGLRKRHPLNPDAIYQALEQHQWRHAEDLLESMKGVIELLETLQKSDVRLGLHREMLENARELLSLYWIDYLDKLDDLYVAHLEWQEKEEQYQTLQNFIATCINVIENRELSLGDFAGTYENIKSLWIEIQEFLEEKGGLPGDEELGFPMLEQICKALETILNTCGEEIESPADEEISLEEAWIMLIRFLISEDFNYFSEAGFDIRKMKFDIIKADVNIIRKVFRRAALRTHPDHGGSNQSFREVNVAYERLRKEIRKSA